MKLPAQTPEEEMIQKKKEKKEINVKQSSDCFYISDLRPLKSENDFAAGGEESISGENNV